MSPPLQKDSGKRGTARAQGNGQRKIRYALVGAGNIAQVAMLPGMRNAAENSELVAIVSGDSDKRRVLAEQYAIEHTGSYEELERVLERGRVDAVYIATPNHLHREHTERAARAKVHVLCEKPMAPTIADCEAMRDVCRAEGVQLMLAYRLHFDEATIAALEIVQSGQIGQPKLFTSLLTQQVRPGDIRTRNQPGAGALFDLGVYPINAARHLFQADPVRVLCSITRGDDRFSGVDASAAATLIFSDERIAQFSVSLDSFGRSSYRVLGESGELAVDPGYAYDEGLRHALFTNGRGIEQTFPKRDQFGAQIAAFSAALLEQREVEPSAEEGLRDVRVVEALLRAAAQGRAVDLPPLPPGYQPSRRQVRAMPGVSVTQPFKAPAPTQ